MDADRELSVAARARRDEALPGLLAEVRARGRRRRTRRAALAAALVLAPLGAWGVIRGDDAAVPVRPRSVAAAPGFEILGDDPSVLARCAVPPPAADAA